MDIASLSGEQLRRQRRNGFALVLQSGMNALNPVRSIGKQFGDVLKAHARPGDDVSAEGIRRRGTELLESVRLDGGVLSRFPHELSGGMRQRVSIALALALQPRLIVFDEPTTALDVIVQQAVMRTIKDLQAERGFTAILISHDLGVVLEATDRVMVMYAGRIVEDQPARVMAARAAPSLHRGAAELLRRPARRRGRDRRHPRIAAGPVAAEHRVLVRPALPAGGGHLPHRRSPAVPAGAGPGGLPRAGPGRARGNGGRQCRLTTHSDDRPGADGQRRVEGLPRPRAGPEDGHGGGRRLVHHLARRGRRPGRGERQRQEHAGQDDHRLGAADGRRDPFGEVAVGRLRAGGLRRLHHQVQMVFQDPYGALNPLHTVEYTVMRPVQNFLGLSAAQARERVAELLETVGLTPASQFAPKLPHQLSGGQRQRVLIARALGSDPELIVADEPVSMLDVSLRAGVLRLLAELRRQRGLSLLYITHDLLSARLVTDEILVLNSGRVVEHGPTKQVLQHPQHSYTIQLLDAVPNPFAAAQAQTGSAQTAGAENDHISTR